MSKRHLCIFVILSIFFLNCFFQGNAFGRENSVKERIKSMEESIKALQKELTRAKDIQEIANLQARYCAVHNTDEHLSWMLFADRPDTSKEITMEKIIGFDNIKASYFRMGGMAGEASSGEATSGAGMGAFAGAGMGGASAGAGMAGGFPGMGGGTTGDGGAVATR